MEILQEFAINNIHCSPGEDRQFRFQLVRATKPFEPITKSIILFNHNYMTLPNSTDAFHVYLIGGIPPIILNLKAKNSPCKGCGGNSAWINVEDDMNERNYIFQIYDDEGYNFPRKNIYYRVSKEGNLVIALNVDGVVRNLFNVDNFKYMRIYSNPYYKGETTDDSIDIKGKLINTRQELVDMQRDINQLKDRGKTLIFINGLFTTEFDINLPGQTYIEYMRDTGMKTMERYKINSLRTFISRMDEKMKYFLYRNKTSDFILYEDDLEVYIVGKDKNKKDRGLYYYQNRDIALRNVTDRDYSLTTEYVNRQASILSELLGGGLQDKDIIVYTRDPMWRRSLVYSALKLHELYKLPHSKQLNVMLNGGASIDEFRVEFLEESNYWKVAGMENLMDLTKELAMDTVGYSAASFYYGNTPKVLTKEESTEVPYIYTNKSTAYEYDQNGLMIKSYNTHGGHYPIANKEAKFIEYIQNRNVRKFNLYKYGDEIIIDPNREYKVLRAKYDLDQREEEWEDITNFYYVKRKGNKLVIELNDLSKFRVVYLDDPYMLDVNIKLGSVFPIITLSMEEVEKGVTKTKPLDVCYDTVEVYLNGRRLVQYLDWFMDFPRIVITNKPYLDYTKEVQNIHIRCTGFNHIPDKINEREVIGFVNNGVLSRNKHYDIRDDRVISIFVDGKMYDRSKVKFAEKDNTVRLTDPLNGKPYTICDKVLNISSLSGLKTYPEFEKSMELNGKISKLYDQIFPEPYINPFNVIGDHHYIFSPLVSTIIRDIISGVISPEIYTRNYQPKLIREFIDEYYPLLTKVDPINKGLPKELVEIHPDYGNMQFVVNAFQYRFIYNLVSLLTEGDVDRCNLSGYLVVNQDTDTVDGDTVYDPGGLLPGDKKP